MTSQLGMYRAATRLYPRTFRDNYREDMVALAGVQLADGPRVFAAARLVRDLTISIPTQHLENLMKRPSPLLVPATSSGLAAVGITLAAVLGSAVSVPLLVLAAVAAVVAAWSFPGARVVRERSLTRHWWQLLLAGAALIGTVVIGEAVTNNRDWAPWIVLVVAVMASWILLAAGAVLAVMHAVRSRHPAGPVLP